MELAVGFLKTTFVYNKGRLNFKHKIYKSNIYHRKECVPFFSTYTPRILTLVIYFLQTETYIFKVFYSPTDAQVNCLSKLSKLV
jgi:hypothetical protein